MDLEIQGKNQNHSEHTYKSIWHVLKFVLFYNISSFYFGYSVVYFNAIPYQTIHTIFAVPFEPSFGEGFLSGIIFFGALFGGIAVKPVIAILSRKHSFYFFNILAIFGVLLGTVLNPYTLILGRILQGFCAGAYSCLVPIVIKQFSPIEIYGVMGAFQNIFFAIGTIFCFVLSFIFEKMQINSSVYWIYIFVFPLATVSLQQILFLTHYHNQTPKYLLIKGQSHQAKELIEQIYLPQFHNAIYHQLLKDLESDQVFEEDLQKQYPKDHWRAVFISVFLAFFMQFCGIQVILTYGIQIGAGFLPDSGSQLPIYLNGIQLVASIIDLYFLEKFTRRFLMINITAVLSLSLLGLYFGFLLRDTNPQLSKYIVLISFFFSICSFVFSVTTVTLIYIPEVVQPSLAPICFAIIWLMGCIVTFLFPIVRQSCGNSDCPAMFLFFSACMALESIVCYFFLVQTKDKTELEIREMFNSNKLH